MPQSPPTRLRPAPRWLAPPDVSQDLVKTLSQMLSLPEALCAFLVGRGMADPDTAKRYLRPEIAHLHPPELMLDMDVAVARIVRAIRAGEIIFMHGDYDVDGITSTALLTRVLRAFGARVVPFVPHRVTDGYDLSDAGVLAALDARATLVITCDCGTSAIAPVDALRARGVDVIITDHHLPGGPLPAALAILNPRRPGCEYPDKDLVAGGVVFKLALAVTRAMKGDDATVFQYLDLVALATIADVAPLRGENRILARHGLKKMATSNVPGIRAMIRAAGLEGKELTAGRIGFILAPRLNATGRIGRAMRGIDLLLTDDDGEALGIARELEELNGQRRDMDRMTLEAARKQIDEIDLDETYGLVIAGEGWHPGVIGIVASRVVEETGRPAILIAVENGIGKGSGRSIAPFDLHSALTECRSHFLRFGGHRAAAGITIDAANIGAFARDFNAIARERLTAEDLISELRVDLHLPLSGATEDLLKLMRHCEPHGVGNPGPTFVAHGVHAEAAPKRVGDNGIRVRLTDDVAALDAISWDFAPRVATIDWTAPMDVAYKLERDEWNGRVRLQARLTDVRQG